MFLAIKQLYLADGTDQEVESLQKEINVIRNLNHENIVRYLIILYLLLSNYICRYLGSNKTERYLFILLEYVPGGSLASILSRTGSFPEELIKY